MPITFTAQQRQALLNTLGRGKAAAIRAEDLARILGYPTTGNQPRLRKLIKECIEHDMDLIGASTGRHKGFFMIDTLVEFDNYIDNLEGRVRSNNDRRNALIGKWNGTNLTNRTTRSSLIIT